MYNRPSDQIPLFIPVSVAARLQPWFNSTILDRGLVEISERRISPLAMMRGAVAAQVENDAVVLLQFKKNLSLHQGFSIESGHCGLCRNQAGSKGCQHQAALAILSLVLPAGQEKPIPLPLAFIDSHWHKLAGFLHEWLSKGFPPCQPQRQGGRVHWRLRPAEGRLDMALPQDHEAIVNWFVNRGKKTESAKGTALLFQQLRQRTMTANERVLEQRGASGIGLQRDASFAFWLAQTFSLLQNGELPRATIDRENGLQLTCSDAHSEAAVTLTVPRHKVWEVVRLCPWSNDELRLLPAARECFRVAFADDSRVEVHPCLRRPDGSLLSRVDMAGQRYSSAFYLPGEGFLPVAQPSDGALIRAEISSHIAGDSAPAPLFAFLQREQDRDRAFFVDINQLPAFLATNATPLRHPENLVDRELLDLRIVDLPERLELEILEAHDDWCYLSCQYGLGNTTISLSEILSARENQQQLLPGKQWLRLDDSPLSWLHDLAATQGLPRNGLGKLRLTYRELLALTALVPDVRHHFRPGEANANRLEQLLGSEILPATALLGESPAHLRPYQRSGLAWMHHLYSFGIGGLLADDMGLGKTHQALALLQAVACEGGGPMLVICPASVLLSWAEKIERFYPQLSCITYYGGNRRLDELSDHHLLLTTYGVVRQDLELLQTKVFSVIILDEIQYLKNRHTAAHQAVQALHSRVKFGLTGTPLENSLQDLRNLFDICLPGLLGSEKFFQRVYERPIVELRDTEAKERLNRLIHPFRLRRSRAQVLPELPEVIMDVRYCELSEDQIGLYREVISTHEEQKAGESGSVMPILAAITRLKQICSHPFLVSESTADSNYRSGKWELFIELSDELVAADIKFVVFTQYLGMVEMIANHFTAAGIGCVTLRGEMNPRKRQAAITAFNHDPSCRVCCASLLAGGTGIDLTGAEAVIHYDRWWNAAKEEQATSRVHRFGQKRVVQVFRLITLGTLEEKIDNLITQKRDLAASLIGEDDAEALKVLDRQQLLALLRLETSATQGPLDG